MAKKKPKIILTDKLRVGSVLVKAFYIVAFVPDEGFGFHVIGTGGMPTSTSAKDGLFPCIGTDRKTAMAQFDLAEKHTKEGTYPKGVLVVVELKAGKIAKLARLSGNMIISTAE